MSICLGRVTCNVPAQGLISKIMPSFTLTMLTSTPVSLHTRCSSAQLTAVMHQAPPPLPTAPCALLEPTPARPVCHYISMTATDTALYDGSTKAHLDGRRACTVQWTYWTHRQRHSKSQGLSGGVAEDEASRLLGRDSATARVRIMPETTR